MNNINRYSRLQGVELIGPEGMARLREAHVAVLGAGNIGGHLLPHLAMPGIETTLIDRDMVSEENLATQMFAEDCLGMPKVVARHMTLAPMNSDWRVHAMQADVTRIGLGALAGVHLIFCCLDSRSARRAVNEMAMRLGVPVVDAALDGSGRTFYAKVAAYDPSRGTSCYVCPNGAGPAAHAGEADGQSCPAFSWDDQETTPATVATSALGAAVAAHQFVWGMKILLGKGQDLVGNEVSFDLELSRMTTQKLPANPRCVLDHRALPLTRLHRSADDITVGETMEKAAHLLSAAPALELLRNSLVTELRCPGCGATRHPNRVLAAMKQSDAVCSCGSTAVPSAAGLRDRFSQEDAADFLDKTWAELGLPPRDVITASAGEKEVHLLLD